VAAAAGLALAVAAGATSHGGPLAALGLGAAALLAISLAVGRSRPIPWALVGLGAEYAVALRLDDAGLDPRAPLLAALLLVCGELAYWCLELRAPAADEPGLLPRRAALLAATGAAAFALGALLLAIAHAHAAGGIALQAAGVAGAVGAVGVCLWLIRRTR
jgi:hypothetical protein